MPPAASVLPERPVKVTRRKRSPAVVLDVEGQLTFETAAVLRGELDQALEQGEAAIVLNLSGVPYVDSSGIAALVEAMQATQKAGRAFALCGLTKTVRNVVSLVRLEKALNTFAGEDQALQELAGSPSGEEAADS